jgi:hypothetical protein
MWIKTTLAVQLPQPYPEHRTCRTKCNTSYPFVVGALFAACATQSAFYVDSAAEYNVIWHKSITPETCYEQGSMVRQAAQAHASKAGHVALYSRWHGHMKCHSTIHAMSWPWPAWLKLRPTSHTCNMHQHKNAKRSQTNTRTPVHPSTQEPLQISAASQTTEVSTKQSWRDSRLCYNNRAMDGVCCGVTVVKITDNHGHASSCIPAATQVLWYHENVRAADDSYFTQREQKLASLVWHLTMSK